MWKFLKKLLAQVFQIKMDEPCKCSLQKLHKVYMVRHGQSEWNKTNQFTGWCDVPLSKRGVEDAKRAAKVIKKANIKFDVVFTSVLDRCIQTVKIILKETDQKKVRIYKSWRLNERHYGDLTGLNKVIIKEKYGKELVQKWRRGYDFAPPPLKEDNPYYCEIINSPLYDKGPPKSNFPKTESLKDTINRVWPYWEESIAPTILNGETVLICAHGNSLRGIIMILDRLTDDQITKLDVANATPFYYILDSNLKVTPNGSMIFMEDQQTVKKAYDFLKSQSQYKPQC